MFLENPSMKSIIDGMMVKEGKTYADFVSLFGFDKIKTGLPYEMLQASTLCFVDKMNWYAPYDTDPLVYNNNDSIYLHVEDYNNATLVLKFANGKHYELKYMYRTDNFPALEIIDIQGKSRKAYHIRELRLTDKLPIDFETTLDIVNNIVPFLTNLLYQAYEAVHK